VIDKNESQSEPADPTEDRAVAIVGHARWATRGVHESARLFRGRFIGIEL